MRIFTFGRAVRLGLLGAGIYYVRKNGGVRAVWTKLVDEANKFIGPVKEAAKEAAKDVGKKSDAKGPMRSMYTSDADFEKAPSSPYGNEPGGNAPADKGFNRG